MRTLAAIVAIVVVAAASAVAQAPEAAEIERYRAPVPANGEITTYHIVPAGEEEFYAQKEREIGDFVFYRLDVPGIPLGQQDSARFKKSEVREVIEPPRQRDKRWERSLEQQNLAEVVLPNGLAAYINKSEVDLSERAKRMTAALLEEQSRVEYASAEPGATEQVPVVNDKPEPRPNAGQGKTRLFQALLILVGLVAIGVIAKTMILCRDE